MSPTLDCFHLKFYKTIYNVIALLRVVTNPTSNLLRVVTNHHGQYDRTKGVYSYSSEPYEQRIGWYKSLSRDPYLLERRVVENINRASIIN